MTALYQIAAEYRHAAHRLSDEADDSALAVLDTLTGELQDKATNIAMLVRNLEASAEAIKAAEAQMAARRRAIDARAQRIRDYLLTHMQACGITRIESPWFALIVRNNPPKVVVDNPGDIPPDFMRQPEPPLPVPDKTLIAQVIKEGEIVPGCHLEAGQRLEIR